MPSASDGPSSPGRGRVQAEPKGSSLPSRLATILTPQGCAKGPRVPSTTTERPPLPGRERTQAPRLSQTRPSRSDPSPRHGASLEFSCRLVRTPPGVLPRGDEQRISYLVDPASSHMLVSKIKPCMSKYRPKQGETANGSLNQLWFIGSYPFLLG